MKNMKYITTIDDSNELIFDDDFNEKIIISNSIVYLHFGNDFDQKIIIPNSVQTLYCGEYFNQKIIIPTFLLHKKLNKVEVGVCPLV